MFTHKANTVYLVCNPSGGGKQERFELEPYTNAERLHVLADYISTHCALCVMNEQGGFIACVFGQLEPIRPKGKKKHANVR